MDQDCDGLSDYDADQDGYDSDSYGGDDCDDDDAAVNPLAVEVYYDGDDANCDGLSDYDADVDGYDSDGYGGPDCDDSDGAVNPGATETWYDGVDQDCDGLSDYDADVDGYDSDTYGGDDCDDSDPAICPGAAEIWYDGVDQDCDGGSDFDQDGDGYGVDTWGTGLDCDDTDFATNPAATEICDDGVDNDCNGAPDPGCGILAESFLSDSDLRLFGDASISAHEVGGCLAWAGDVDGLAGDELIVGATDESWPTESTGYAYLIDASATGYAEISTQATAVIESYESEQLGWAVAGAGDADGDGYDDVLVGAPNGDYGATNGGVAYLLYGPLSGTISADPAVEVILYGSYSGLNAGWSLAGGGDHTGDGVPDLVVGCIGSSSSSYDGVAYIVPGPVSASTDLASVAYAGGASLEGATSDWASYDLADVGDADGDGLDDLLIGATGQSRVFLTEGSLSGALQLSSMAHIFTATSEDTLGQNVGAPGDTDGDGYADLLMADHYVGGNQRGLVYLVRGPVTADMDLTSGTDATLYGYDWDHAGTDLGTAGDLDGDGWVDFLVGADGADTSLGSASGPGGVYIMPGDVSGSLTPADAIGILYGDVDDDLAGRAVAGAGDLDGDGLPDLAVGAPGYDTTGSLEGILTIMLGSGL